MKRISSLTPTYQREVEFRMDTLKLSIKKDVGNATDIDVDTAPIDTPAFLAWATDISDAWSSELPRNFGDKLCNLETTYNRHVSENRYRGATGSPARRNDHGGSFLEPDLVFKTGNGNCVSFLS